MKSLILCSFLLLNLSVGFSQNSESDEFPLGSWYATGSLSTSDIDPLSQEFEEQSFSKSKPEVNYNSEFDDTGIWKFTEKKLKCTFTIDNISAKPIGGGYVSVQRTRFAKWRYKYIWEYNRETGILKIWNKEQSGEFEVDGKNPFSLVKIKK